MISLFRMWGKTKLPWPRFVGELKHLIIQALCPDSLNNAQDDLGALKWAPQQAKNTLLGLKAKNPHVKSHCWAEPETAWSGRQEMLKMEMSCVHCSSLELRLPAPGWPRGSLHSSFSAQRPYVEVSTQSFLPTFDKAQDTFLFWSSDGGFLLSLPCSFHWILLYTEVFPYCESLGPEERQALLAEGSGEHFSTTTVQATCTAGTLLAVKAVWLPKHGIL